MWKWIFTAVKSALGMLANSEKQNHYQRIPLWVLFVRGLLNTHTLNRLIFIPLKGSFWSITQFPVFVFLQEPFFAVLSWKYKQKYLGRAGGVWLLTRPGPGRVYLANNRQLNSPSNFEKFYRQLKNQNAARGCTTSKSMKHGLKFCLLSTCLSWGNSSNPFGY